VSAIKSAYYSGGDNGNLMQSMRKIQREFYEELEGVILCAMAAGVPASHFVMTQPELKIDGFNATMVCGIGFKEVIL